MPAASHSTAAALSPALRQRLAPAAIETLQPTQALRPGQGVPSLGESDLALLRQAFAPHRLRPDSLDRLRTGAVVLSQPIGMLGLPGPAQPLPCWWLLRRGRVSLGWVSDRGEFTEHHPLVPGDWLEVAGALAQPPRWTDAVQCRTPVELLALPLRLLFEVAADDPALQQAMTSLLCGRVRELADTLRDVVSADVPARLARWMLRRLKGDGDALDPAALPVLQLADLKQTIAAQIGTTSETFSRALRRLQDAAIVQVDGYRVTLLDREALERVAHPRGRGSARQSFARGRKAG